MKKVKLLIFFLFIFSSTFAYASNEDFDNWLKDFKKIAIDNNISENTFELVMKNVKFLPKVIEYDRYQPEFYEDTKTYITKRTSKKKVKNGVKLYNKNKKLIDEVDNKFNVEKELLLALMGIETNFGLYLGKMDILSSLSTLSYDKRRTEFFTQELLTLLKLIENGVINHEILYGSWAGAFGNFQFMPSTIKNYAIDYDQSNIIDLKSINDSFASAANYINKIGWKKKQPCYLKVQLNNAIPKIFLNTSAKKIKNKKKAKFFKKYIVNYEDLKIDDNLRSAIITPDQDIIDNAEPLSPAFMVFDNYDLILKWNRSLRFALAVCKLKDEFKNAL